jgi:hypothetical protein
MHLHSTGRYEIPGSGIIAVTGDILMSNPAGRPRIYADVTLTCRRCGEPFSMRGSQARAYEKKHGRAKPYCSMKCFYEVAQRHPIDLTEDAPLYVCAGCGKETRRRRDVLHGKIGQWDMRQKYCTLECSHKHTAAQFAARRATGDYGVGHISKDGYRVFKGAGGKQIKEHRMVMEKILGRALRGNENVHHINGNRSDNRPENLELWVKTQPCGQRATDKVSAYLEFLNGYPELVEAAGYRLCRPDKCRGG